MPTSSWGNIYCSDLQICLNPIKGMIFISYVYSYKNHWLNTKERFMFSYVYKSRNLDPIQSEEATDRKHSNPVDAHAQRPLVPWFTGVQEAHFKANVQRKRLRRALRSATKHRLRNPSRGRKMRDQRMLKGMCVDIFMLTWLEGIRLYRVCRYKICKWILIALAK